MTARLFCKTGDLAGTEFQIERDATIGKSAGNTIVLTPGTISGQHARIFYDDNAQAYYLEDSKSRNGTRLDGMPVSAAERLGRLHVITFANAYDFIFLIPQDAAQVSAPPPVAVSEEPVEPRAAVSPTAAVQDLPPVPPVLNVDRAGSGRTIAESDVPLLSPNFQKGAPPASPKTMAESDIPLMTPNFQGNQPAAPKTMAASDIPQIPKFGAQQPQQQPQQPQQSKTMAASDIPQIPKFGTQQPPQQKAPPQPQQQPPQQSRTMAESDIPLLPQFNVPPAQPAAAGQTVRYILEVMKDNKQFVLGPGENIVGRSEKSKIPIEHSTVSRKHAMITVAGSRVTLKDLGSANHTFVDNQKIESEVEITPGNKIRFGQVEVRLLSQR